MCGKQEENIVTYSIFTMCSKQEENIGTLYSILKM